MSRFAHEWRQRIRKRFAEREEVPRDRIYTGLWAGLGFRPDEVKTALALIEEEYGIHPGRLRAGDEMGRLFAPVDPGWNPMRRLAWKGCESKASDRLSVAANARMERFGTREAWRDSQARTLGDWVAVWSGRLPGGQSQGWPVAPRARLGARRRPRPGFAARP